VHKTVGLLVVGVVVSAQLAWPVASLPNVGAGAVLHRGGSSRIIMGEGALPHQPLHHRLHFLRSQKTKKYELHIGLHLKSRVEQSVMG